MSDRHQREGLPCCDDEDCTACVPRPATVLEEAQAAVEQREAIYGATEGHHGLTARLWGAYLGREITAAEVCVLMVLDKIARQRTSPEHRDHYTDIAGYAELAARNAGA